ncbi:hypothetical protein ES708_21536 [subsurface metagenome]
MVVKIMMAFRYRIWEVKKDGSISLKRKVVISSDLFTSLKATRIIMMAMLPLKAIRNKLTMKMSPLFLRPVHFRMMLPPAWSFS